jgi:hypothetical protein
MKNLCLTIGLCLLCGCAQTYVMELSNGVVLTTASKPKLKGGYYHYKGPKGEEQLVPQSRVRMVQPESMAKEENKFKVSQPKKKHWYWPF